MTQEEKAKAYDEAIERAKELLEIGLKDTRDKRVVLSFFPELAESEDERIRKDLIAIFKGEIPFTSEEDAKRYIAWLEKQEGCEHIKKEWLEHIKQSWYKEGFIDGKYNGGTSKEWTINDTSTLNELIDFLENGTAKLQHDLTRYANWLKIQFTPIEMQGEQKPVEENNGNLGGISSNSAWSEEDERLIKISIACLSDFAAKGYENAVECIDWIKSLKQRMV